MLYELHSKNFMQVTRFNKDAICSKFDLHDVFCIPHSCASCACLKTVANVVLCVYIETGSFIKRITCYPL